MSFDVDVPTLAEVWEQVPTWARGLVYTAVLIAGSAVFGFAATAAIWFFVGG